MVRDWGAKHRERERGEDTGGKRVEETEGSRQRVRHITGKKQRK